MATIWAEWTSGISLDNNLLLVRKNYRSDIKPVNKLHHVEEIIAK